MNSTINIRVHCYDWEKSKENVLDGLNQIRDYVSGYTDGWQDYEFGLFKSGNQISKEVFYKDLNSFIELIEKRCDNDEDNVITFSSLEDFTIVENDIENGELDFENSLALSVAYDNVVDCIIFQMKTNGWCSDIYHGDDLEKYLPGWGDFISGSANDIDGDFLEELE
tara:strand:+ start:107 stop:607 length:501 start_codon:yes stop_codon:yes gene_type:complete